MLLVLGMGRKVGLHFLFQPKAAFCQAGDALVRELELLFEVRDAGLQGSRRGRSFVVHNRILLLLL